MRTLSIHPAQQAAHARALKLVVGVAAALLAAFLFGALMSADWTLPVDPAVGYVFTA